MLIIPIENALLQPGPVRPEIRNASMSFDPVHKAVTVKTELMSDYQRVVRQHTCQHVTDDEMHSLVRTHATYDNYISLSSAIHNFSKEDKLITEQDTKTKDGHTIPGYIMYRYKVRNQFCPESGLDLEVTLSTPYSFNEGKYQVSRLEMSYDPMNPVQTGHGRDSLHITAIYAYLFGKDHKDEGHVYGGQNCGNKFLFENHKLISYENRRFKMGFDTQTGLCNRFEARDEIKPNQQKAFQKCITEFFEESDMLVTMGKTLHSDIRKELRLDLI